MLYWPQTELIGIEIFTMNLFSSLKSAFTHYAYIVQWKWILAESTMLVKTSTWVTLKVTALLELLKSNRIKVFKSDQAPLFITSKRSHFFVRQGSVPHLEVCNLASNHLIFVKCTTSKRKKSAINIYHSKIDVLCLVILNSSNLLTKQILLEK